MLFEAVAPTAAELTEPRAGDAIVAHADVVMNRGFTVPGTPEQVWPWLVQLGKGRAGWYLPRTIERFTPPSRRGLRTVNPLFQHLEVGDVIPDYGGRTATFRADVVEAPTTLVYSSTRGTTGVSWSITLAARDSAPVESATHPVTRLHFRLRLGPVKHIRLAESAGGFFDLLTIAGLAHGLRERLSD